MLQLLVAVFGTLILFASVGMFRSLYLQYRKDRRLLEYHILHLVLWIMAVGSLSGCLATYRRLSGEWVNSHPAMNVVGGLVYLLALLASFLILGFFMYRDDRRNGKVTRRIRLYERFVASGVIAGR